MLIYIYMMTKIKQRLSHEKTDDKYKYCIKYNVTTELIKVNSHTPIFPDVYIK